MALRFLTDHCISNSIIQSLQNAQHEVVRLKDVLPVESSDAMVIAKAQELDAILLSLNGDFADIIVYPPATHKGIITLKMRNHPEILPQLLGRLAAYLNLHPTIGHYRGKLFVVESGRIRIRAGTL